MGGGGTDVNADALSSMFPAQGMLLQGMRFIVALPGSAREFTVHSISFSMGIPITSHRARRRSMLRPYREITGILHLRPVLLIRLEDFLSPIHPYNLGAAL